MSTSNIESNLTLTTIPEYASVCTTESHPDFCVVANLAAPMFEEKDRAPLTIVACIDRSGSMNGEKIKLVKETLLFTIKNLRSDDKFALITYQSVVDTPLGLTLMDQYGKEKANKAVNEIKPGGSTNLCDALITAMRMMMKREKRENEVSAILLLTDGHANISLTSAEDIIGAMKNPHKSPASSGNYTQEKEPKLSQVYNKKQPRGGHSGNSSHMEDDSSCDDYGTLDFNVNCFGFGKDHSAALLNAISEQGNGTYSFIQDSSFVPIAFGECVGGLVSTVAQQTKLTITPLQTVVLNQVCASYVVTDDGPSKVVNITDIQSEESRDILIKLNLPSTPYVQPFALVQLTLSYLNCATGQMVEEKSIVQIERTLEPTSQADARVDAQRNRLTAADVIETAEKLAAAGNLDEAKKLIDSTISAIRESVSGQETFVQGLLLDLEKVKAGFADTQTYQKQGHHWANELTTAHKKQRKTPQTSSYQTSSKNKYTTSYTNM